jgi:LCP family protein required for cell wall assembly
MPRDSYVPLHTYGQMDKLTHSGIYGVDETMNTVTDWLGVDFDYYVKVNFTMVVKLIDAMGGIAVYSDHDFHSSLKPDYYYFKGKNRLGGYRALYFARERKSFEESDQTRIENQQRVMEGIINKVTTHKEILLNYKELLAIVAENMATDLSDDDLAALARMQLSDMDTKWTVESYCIKATGASRGTYSMGMGRNLYVAIPEDETVEEAKKRIHDVMYPPAEEDEPKTDMEKLVEDQVDTQEETQEQGD